VHVTAALVLFDLLNEGRSKIKPEILTHFSHPNNSTSAFPDKRVRCFHVAPSGLVLLASRLDSLGNLGADES
jgi:hypothetical protein